MKRRDLVVGALAAAAVPASVRSEAHPYVRWEHKFVAVPEAKVNREEWRLEVDEALAAAEKLADAYAADGWEYVSMQTIPHVLLTYMVFRRGHFVGI